MEGLLRVGDLSRLCLHYAPVAAILAALGFERGAAGVGLRLDVVAPVELDKVLVAALSFARDLANGLELHGAVGVGQAVLALGAAAAAEELRRHGAAEVAQRRQAGTHDEEVGLDETVRWLVFVTCGVRGDCFLQNVVCR